MKKYIILGNGFDWCELSFHGLEERNDILFFNSKLPLDMNRISSKFARYYFSRTLNRFCKLPFKWKWYPSFYVNLQLEKESSQVLIIYDKNMLGCNVAFLKDVKKCYPKLKLVYVFTNIVKYSGAKINKFEYKLKDYYDVVLAFDMLDAKKYGFAYSPLVYNADKKYLNRKQDNQVFYVGTAKDRLKMLVEAYKRLIGLGVKCDFNIAEVNETEIDKETGIQYNIRKPYSEVLQHIARSECLLDIIQGESSGLTIKVCEAICYDKKLITTNVHVKENSFYDEKYILIIKDVCDITKEFLDSNKDVHYKLKDKLYFSTAAFLERIEQLLLQDK